MVREHTKSSGLAAGSPTYRMLEEMIGEMPIGKIAGLSGGKFGLGMARGLCTVANGNRIRGIMMMVGIGSRRD